MIKREFDEHGLLSIPFLLYFFTLIDRSILFKKKIIDEKERFFYFDRTNFIFLLKKEEEIDLILTMLYNLTCQYNRYLY